MQNFESLIAKNYLSNLSQIRANAFLSSAFLEQIKRISNLQQTFAVQLAESLFSAIKFDGENEQGTNENFKTVIETTIQNQPDAKSKLEVLTFIFTIIGVVFGGIGAIFGGGQFYYSYLQYESSRQDSIDNDKKFSQFMEVLQEIARKIDRSTESKEVYCLVERQVNVRIKPNFNSATIVVIYPNQKVRLVKKEHKWIYIEYFDYIDGVLKNGWVSKKYLVKIK